MSWRNIQKPDSIWQAICECDRLGQGEFLRKYGYGKATKYRLVANDKFYDPKAILGAAHKYEFGYPLHRNQVKNAKGRKQKFEQLGFVIVTVENSKS